MKTQFSLRSLCASSSSTKVSGLRLLSVACVALWLGSISSASAFPHVLQKEETLASLAKLYYGKMQNEGLLAAANGFKSEQGDARQLALHSLTPGMVLEIPAPRYLRVTEGQTWKTLAEQWLGSEKRAFVLADMNGFKPWHEPEAGQLIVLPYPLAWLSNGRESLASLAYRYLGSTKYAYRLLQFNSLKAERPERGQTILLPIVDLELTPHGQQAALAASMMLKQQSDVATKKLSDEAANSLRQLQLKNAAGHYTQVIANGSSILTRSFASQTTEAEVHHQLLIAAVALESKALARQSCEAMRRLAPETQLSPLYTSPKILKVCPNPAQKDESNTTP